MNARNVSREVPFAANLRRTWDETFDRHIRGPIEREDPWGMAWGPVMAIGAGVSNAGNAFLGDIVGIKQPPLGNYDGAYTARSAKQVLGGFGAALSLNPIKIVGGLASAALSAAEGVTISPVLDAGNLLGNQGYSRSRMHGTLAA